MTPSLSGPSKPPLDEALAACRGGLAAVLVFSLCINLAEGAIYG